MMLLLSSEACLGINVWFGLVVCEVPEARQSVIDKTTDSDKVCFNTKHDCTVYTQLEMLDHLLNWSSKIKSFAQSRRAERCDTSRAWTCALGAQTTVAKLQRKLSANVLNLSFIDILVDIRSTEWRVDGKKNDCWPKKKIKFLYVL